jgi:uncharacterized protein (DUF4415 family)
MMRKTLKTFVAGRGYSKEDWESVSEMPELLDPDVTKGNTFKEIFPELAERALRARGKQKAPTKTRVTLRIDSATIAAFKATGPGWQTRINSALKSVMPNKGGV